MFVSIYIPHFTLIWWCHFCLHDMVYASRVSPPKNYKFLYY